ncbi:hypothetical protein [Fimbriiglobus ruber]|uniref:Uncharacterized protein n=1 Tax=Fimbriiglobus ruber TaxID=1908690 RepID=A0A225CXR8_9BACT|nr:hypothetical protein [Fimbriiglobus ruber]OWK34160.1 hypothetical protein FRUB_10131 [Fimbriiglobus ruber]
MNAFVPIALFGWVPACLALFAFLPKHRAVIAAFLIAWLFLPVVHEPVLGIKWTKMRATCYGILLAAVIYDGPRLFALRPKASDIPVLVWCTCPFPSSIVNGLGPYDGFSQSLEQTISWGMPYLIGRVYLNSPTELKELCLAMIGSGIVYAPLCFVETQMSPQMHTWVYGYFPHSFAQTIRFGGYRPVVFMEHGLAVGSWMTTATLLAFWLWWVRSMQKVTVRKKTVPMLWVFVLMAVITVLCKSSGAIGLGVIGAAVLLSARYIPLPVPPMVLLLVLIFPAYVYGRGWGGWTGMELGEAMGNSFDKERAASFIFRLDNENLLLARAKQSPLLGWGGWGRNRVFDIDGKDITVTDGLWIIAFGERGVYGLIAMTGTLLVPAIRILVRFPARVWAAPAFGPAAALAVSLVLYAVDGLLNAMINPVFMLIAGGLNSLTLAQVESAGRRSVGDGAAAVPKPVSAPRRARIKYPVGIGAA